MTIWTSKTSEFVSQLTSTMRRFLSSTRSITRAMTSPTGSCATLLSSGRRSSTCCSACRFTLHACRSAPITNRFSLRRVSRSRGPSRLSAQVGGSTKWRLVTSNLSPMPPPTTAHHTVTLCSVHIVQFRISGVIMPLSTQSRLLNRDI